MPPPRFEITDRVKHYSGETGQVADILGDRNSGYRYRVIRGPSDRGVTWPEPALSNDESHTMRKNSSGPKFRPGDKVTDLEGSMAGTVMSCTANGPLSKSPYRYLVQETSGGRYRERPWNEDQLKLLASGSGKFDMRPNAKGISRSFKPTLTSGKRVDYLYGRNDSTLLVYVTKEPDGLFYVWTRKDLGGRPDWTYGYKSQPTARAEMQRLGGYDGDPVGWEQGLSKNASRSEPDETAARELSLYIENEYSLVGAPNSQGKAIEKNLLLKLKKGTFDLALSEKAWMYLMEAGAKKYSKEYSDGRDWSVMFNKATRELVAHEFATTFYGEHKATGGLARNSSDDSVEDPDYIIQGMYSDGTVCIDFGFDDEEKTVREAKKLLREPWFEGDRVRVITRDGELIYSSEE